MITKVELLSCCFAACEHDGVLKMVDCPLVVEFGRWRTNKDARAIPTKSTVCKAGIS